MDKFTQTYLKCMDSLNDYYTVGAFDWIETQRPESWKEMLVFEDEICRLWDGDFDTFRAVVVKYYRFMKDILKEPVPVGSDDAGDKDCARCGRPGERFCYGEDKSGKYAWRFFCLECEPHHF